MLRATIRAFPAGDRALSADRRTVSAMVGGWEVLSPCPERFTRTLIANHYRSHVLLGELVPPELQLRTSEKQTLRPAG